MRTRYFKLFLGVFVLATSLLAVGVTQAAGSTYQEEWVLNSVHYINLLTSNNQSYFNGGIPVGPAGWSVSYCMGGTVDSSGNCTGQTTTVKENWTVDTWGTPVKSLAPSSCVGAEGIIGLGPDTMNTWDAATTVTNTGASGLDTNTTGRNFVGTTYFWRTAAYGVGYHCTDEYDGSITQFPVRWKVTGTITTP